MIDIVTFRNHKSVKGQAEQLTWEALTERLHTVTETACDPCPRFEADGVTKHTCPLKNGPAWSPVVLDGPRANVNVRSVSALVLDLDHVKAADLRPFLETLAPYRHIVHSTHSHRPPSDLGLRAVVALSRPVRAADWRRFYAAATKMLGVPPGLDARDDPARLFYLPSAPSSRIGRFFKAEGDGAALDVDAVLATAAAVAPGPVMSTPYQDPPDDADTISVDDFVKAMRDLRRRYKAAGNARKLGLIEAAIEGRELVPTGHGQDPALNELMGILAFKLPPGTPASCVVPLIDKSIVAMGAGPEGLDHWRAKAAYMFDRAKVRLAKKSAENEALIAGLAPNLKNALARADAVKSGTPAVAEESVDEPDVPPDWVSRLIFLPNTSPPKLDPCPHNAEVILESSPEWFGVIRFNEVTKVVEVGPGHPLGWDVSLENLACAVVNHLKAKWGLQLGEAQVFSCIGLVAGRNKYDPLSEYLHGLTWDGTPRLDTFLERATGARVVSEDGKDITAHVRRVSRKWLISAAARAIRPGCKVDTVLVLEGEQGAGKSSLLKILAGDFFADAPVNLEDKDTRVLAAQSWILEVAELTSFRRSEADALKAFFSGKEDKLRPAYGRTIVTYKRRCVFVGTVNPEVGVGYLTDTTGNRRYWPIRVGQVDLAWVRANREQLWAEAVQYAKQAFAVSDRDGDEHVPADLRWWLDREEEREAAAEAVERVQRSPMVELIIEHYLSTPVEKRLAWVTTTDIAQLVLQLDPDKATERARSMVIGKALRDAGFTPKRRRKGDRIAPGYDAPESLMTATHTPKRGANLALVAGGKP